MKKVILVVVTRDGSGLINVWCVYYMCARVCLYEHSVRLCVYVCVLCSYSVKEH